jgi:hypothetical protein
MAFDGDVYLEVIIAVVDVNNSVIVQTNDNISEMNNSNHSHSMMAKLILKLSLLPHIRIWTCDIQHKTRCVETKYANAINDLSKNESTYI